MDYVARHGWDVYLVDVRGYGGSIRPPEMAQPAANNPPVASYDEAVKDVGVAVDFILKRRGVPKLNLIGWSHGTVLMGAYAARHAEKVERLVLHAPPWLRTPSSSQTATRQFGAYDETTIAIVRERQQVGAPENRKNDLMPMAWFETWAAAVLASDPLSSKQNPPVLRYPTGMRQGVRNYWEAGKPSRGLRLLRLLSLVSGTEWPLLKARTRFSASSRAALTSGWSSSVRERISLCWRRTGCSFSGRCNSSSIGGAKQTDRCHRDATAAKLL
jgi:pimeloyl-ACP methyl ester carboxylesterase